MVNEYVVDTIQKNVMFPFINLFILFYIMKRSVVYKLFR